MHITHFYQLTHATSVCSSHPPSPGSHGHSVKEERTKFKFNEKKKKEKKRNKRKKNFSFTIFCTYRCNLLLFLLWCWTKNQ